MAAIRKYDNHAGLDQAMAENGNRLVSLVEGSGQNPKNHRGTRTNQQRIGT
jgi:hypothetical protein